MPPVKPNVQRVPKKKDDTVIRFTVDGERHTLDVKDISGIDAKHFRAGVGITINHAMTIFKDAVGDDDAKVNIDIDLIAGLVFLAKRQAGNKNIKFDAVAGEITYASDIALGDEDDDEEVDEDPQT